MISSTSRSKIDKSIPVTETLAKLISQSDVVVLANDLEDQDLLAGFLKKLKEGAVVIDHREGSKHRELQGAWFVHAPVVEKGRLQGDCIV